MRPSVRCLTSRLYASRRSRSPVIALPLLSVLCLVVVASACVRAKPAFVITQQDIPPASAHPAAQLSLEERLSTHMKFLTFILSIRRWGSIPGFNVAGILGDPGEQPTIVVCAHRDAVAVENRRLIPTPGAIDNASGTAALLEIARTLGANPAFRSAAVFASVDGEEFNLTGSKEFVRHLPFTKSNPSYVLNLDGIAVRGAQEMELYATAGSDTAAAVRDIVSDSLKAAGLSVVLTDRRVGSDEESFEKAGCPAVAIHAKRESMDPYIHTPRDTVDAVDPKVLAAIVRAVMDGIAKGISKGQ